MEKYYLWKFETQKNRKKSKPKPSFLNLVVVVILWIYLLDIFFEYIYLQNNFVEMRIENATFPITRQHTDLDMNFISIKKHEQETTLNFLFSRKVP